MECTELYSLPTTWVTCTITVHCCTLGYNEWAGRDADQAEGDHDDHDDGDDDGDQELVARVSPGECALLLSHSPTLRIPLVTESDNLLQELTSDQVRS